MENKFNQAKMLGQTSIALNEGTHFLTPKLKAPMIHFSGLESIVSSDLNHSIMTEQTLCYSTPTHGHGEPARENFLYRGNTAPVGGINPDLLNQFSYLFTKFILYDTNDNT